MAHQAQKQTPKPITAAQIRRIHTIINILNVSDDNYRAALDSRFGVTTCKDLTLMQAKSFIDELEKLALQVNRDQKEAQPEEAEQKAPQRFSNLDNRQGMASGAQLRKIEAMWQDVSIVPDQDARSRALRQFIKRVAGVADMRFLDSQGASKIINALNAMQKQANAPKSKTLKKGE